MPDTIFEIFSEGAWHVIGGIALLLTVSAPTERAIHGRAAPMRDIAFTDKTL